MSTSATGVKPVVQPVPRRSSALKTLRNALIVSRREIRDSLRDWRIIAPIVILTFLFPALAQFVAGRLSAFVEGFGAELIGERLIPFLLMIVGFFPISISLVIALETFVGEKERRSLEPLLSTPLTNTELYIGKTLAAMLPPLFSSYGGMAVYLSTLVFGDLAWRPQPALIIQIIVLTTVQALVMVTGAVVVSSQTTSTRAANLLASFIIIPMALVIQGESAIMFLAPDAESPSGIGALWAICAGMLVVVMLLLRLGASLFNREELLGRSLDTLNFRGTIRKIGHYILAVDIEGTPARSFWDWFHTGVLGVVSRLGLALPITVLVFVGAFIAGLVIGHQPEWHLPLPRDVDLAAAANQMDLLSGSMFGSWTALFIFWQNWRVLALATALGMFTFGTAVLVLTPAAYVILGYIFSQIMVAGYNPLQFLPTVLTHGIVEIPVIVLATAAALRLGAVITRPPHGMTVGHGWVIAFADTIKLWLGLILPGLLLGAVIEALITPRIVALTFGG